MAETEKYRCGVEITLNLIGGKWKGLILWPLCQKTLRFGQLGRRIGGITQKILTQQLRELERDGLVNRQVFPEVPPKVEYSLAQREAARCRQSPQRTNLSAALP